MIKINDIEYEIVENERDALDIDLLKEKVTDYFVEYDYIVGDWAYGKLRLKGFNEKSNKDYKPINDMSKMKQYIEDYCAYGCKYFIIKRIKLD